MSVCTKCGRGKLWCPKCSISFCPFHRREHLGHCYRAMEKASGREYEEIAYSLLLAIPNATVACELLAEPWAAQKKGGKINALRTFRNPT